MTTATTAELFCTSITDRLDRLEEQATELRMNAIKMICYLKTSANPALYQKCIAACCEAGLATTSPIASFSGDVAAAIREAIDAQ